MNPQDPYQPPQPSYQPQPGQQPAPQTQSSPQDQSGPQPQPNSSQPTQPQNSKPHHKQHVGDELVVMQPGEVKILELKRHPVGIIVVYAMITLVLGAVGVLTLGIMPSMDSSSSDQMARLGIGLFSIVALLGMLYALVATVVYWGNRWVLTSDSVTQIERISLFGKQSSQLALSNIEDVTAEQHGILTHIFNFGTLKAETAGHHGKFVFPYAPNPNYYAQQILQAREAVVAAGHGGHH